MPRKPLSSLSVFIPLYRDEQTVVSLTEKTILVARELTDDFEIILIDDASPDRAGEYADRLAERHPEIRVIHHEKNSGVGPVMIEGFLTAKKEFVFYTDGDAQYDVNELMRFAPFASLYDVIIGYRIKRAEGFFRVFTSRSFHLMAFMLFGFRYRDIDCSFKLLNRRFLDRVQFHSESALVDLEILIQANRKGFPIKEIGVRHLPRQYGHSQCLRLGLILAMIKDLFRIRFTFYRKKPVLGPIFRTQKTQTPQPNPTR